MVNVKYGFVTIYMYCVSYIIYILVHPPTISRYSSQVDYIDINEHVV